MKELLKCQNSDSSCNYNNFDCGFDESFSFPDGDPNKRSHNSEHFFIGGYQQRQQVYDIDKNSAIQIVVLFLFLTVEDHQQADIRSNGFFVNVIAEHKENAATQKDQNIKVHILSSEVEYKKWQGDC